MTNSADKFVVIGFGADLGTCTAKTKAGSKCTNFVNLQTGQLCTTHVMQQYTRAAGARGAFSAKNGSLPDKYKGTMWDKVKGQTFFGGGQMAQALPPSINPASSSCDRLSKLANSHAEKFVKEVKKNPGIMINSGVKRVITDDTNKMVQSSRHGGRLLAAALGQSERNESLLQSRKVKTGSKELKSISAAELLKQKNAEFLEQRKEAIRKKKLAAAMAQSAKKVTAPNNDKLIIAGLPPSQNMFTKLQQVKPRITPESLNTNERAKLRAAMLLKEKNAKKPKTPPKSSKDLIMEKVDMNRAGKKPTKTTTPSPKEKKMTFLGKTVESKDVKEIFKKKSMYHDTIENLVSAQKDFYFSILEKKEEIAMKMDGVMKAESQAVTCKQCKYTYWSPHENCKKNNHELKWSKGFYFLLIIFKLILIVTKRWFQCSNCPASRCITMDQYPRITCANCGSSTKWKRSAANDTHVKNITEASSLLVRGEERKWVNS